MSTRRTMEDAGLDRIVEAVITLQAEGRRQAREQGARVGLSPTQLNVIKLLDEIGELSLSDLSKRIRSQSSAVTGIVDRMVDAGLVERRQSDEDRRVWRIRLTDKGRKLSRQVRVAPWDWLRNALASLDGEEKKHLVAILTKLATHVEGQMKDG